MRHRKLLRCHAKELANGDVVPRDDITLSRTPPFCGEHVCAADRASVDNVRAPIHIDMQLSARQPHQNEAGARFDVELTNDTRGA